MIVGLALATGISASVWEREDDEVIVTALEILSEED